MKAITPEMEYLSTRQSAKVLQVSLGTVQKMVELGELIAWKTRGGHRRILASSLDQQLARRKRAMRQKTTQNCIAMGIFRRVENSHELIESIQCWQLKVDMEVSVDSLEGLMKAVSIAPATARCLTSQAVSTRTSPPRTTWWCRRINTSPTRAS
jgi:excisionase family DNA binding protein